MAAAKRVADLGNPDIAAQLYAQGMKTSQQLGNTAATTRKLNSEASEDDINHSELIKLQDQRDLYLKSMDSLPPESNGYKLLQQKVDEATGRIDKLVHENEPGGGGAVLSMVKYLEAKHVQEGGKPFTEGETKKLMDQYSQNSGLAQQYNLYSNQERAAGRVPKEYNDWLTTQAAAQSTGKEAPVKGMDILSTERTQAIAGREQMAAMKAALDTLNTGKVATGTLSNARKQVARAFSTLTGIPYDDKSTDSMTDQYLAFTRNAALSRVKALGANPSDADRDFIMLTTGSDPSVIEPALRNILRFQYNTAKRNVDQYHTDLGAHKEQVVHDAFQPVDVSKMQIGDEEWTPPSQRGKTPTYPTKELNGVKYEKRSDGKWYKVSGGK
jgi:hypothetical protein